MACCISIGPFTLPTFSAFRKYTTIHGLDTNFKQVRIALVTFALRRTAISRSFNNCSNVVNQLLVINGSSTASNVAVISIRMTGRCGVSSLVFPRRPSPSPSGMVPSISIPSGCNTSVSKIDHHQSSLVLSCNNSFNIAKCASTIYTGVVTTSSPTCP